MERLLCFDFPDTLGRALTPAQQQSVLGGIQPGKRLLAALNAFQPWFDVTMGGEEGGKCFSGPAQLCLPLAHAPLTAVGATVGVAPLEEVPFVNKGPRKTAKRDRTDDAWTLQKKNPLLYSPSLTSIVENTYPGFPNNPLENAVTLPDGRHLVASKDDGAKIPTHIWSEFLLAGIPHKVLDKDANRAMITLRGWHLQYWKRNVTKSFFSWIRVSAQPVAPATPFALVKWDMYRFCWSPQGRDR
jgi:hypothetical protein